MDSDFSGTQRDRQHEPHVPAFEPVLGAELVKALEVRVPFSIADLEEVAELGTDRGDLRLEIAEHGARAAVTGELMIEGEMPLDH